MTDSKQHKPAELAASYALGALDAGELREFEEHLGACADCRRKVEEYRAVTDLLAYGATARQPPAALRERILASARASPPEQPAAPSHELPAARRWTPAAALLAAASVLLASVATIGYVRERQARQGVEAELAQAVDELSRTVDDLARREELLQAFLGEPVSAARLTSTQADPSIRLFWNRNRDSLLVAALSLPPAAPGRVYQLWGIPDGQSPVSLGTFNTDAAGRATVVLTVPAGIDVADSAVSAVTDEPDGGSPQPTTTPFLVGSWDHGQ